jgi:hypothetical protein
MTFFERPYTVRRFGETVEVNGYETAAFAETVLQMDVQVVVPSGSEFNADGQRKSERLNSWGNDRLNTADPKTGRHGDQLLYEDGFWYECVSCRRRSHTVLRHWRGEWVRLPEGSDRHYDSAGTESGDF